MLVAVACGGDAPASNNDVQNVDNTTANTPVPTSQTTTETEGVLATVNGKPITKEVFDRAFVRIAGNSDASDTSALAVQVLNTLIEQEVIAQAAENLNIAVSDADVDAEINALKSSVVGSDTTWENWLAINQYSEDELREALRESILTNRVRDHVIAQLGESVNQVHARHILVASEEEAQDIMTRLAGGEDFATLAGDLSLDVTTRDFGGDLGWFMREELLDVTLADEAFRLEPGEIAGPVSTRIGYHVIQTLEKGARPVEPERMPFLVENVFNRWLENQLLDATIERFQ